MKGSMTRDYLVIGFSFLIGMILTLIPFPQWAVWLRPHWILAILIFWLMTASHRVGIGFAWFIGLFMDLVAGTILGQQALIFCITAYFVLKFQHWFVNVSIFQQTAIIFLLMLFNLTIDRCLLVIFQHTTVNWFFWLPALTTAVIWPWLSGLLYIYQIKLRVADVA